MKFIKPNFWKTNNLIVYLLWPLTFITNLIILFKNNKKSYNSQTKSICIGNIYLGGTGKTSLVIKVNEILKKKFKTFVIKKYYKNQIDEQKILGNKTRLILPKRRIEGLRKIERSKNSIAIFDDGLQDKSIKYKISIVCFNSFSAIGNGKLLPAGPLRESMSSLNNYSAVFINGKKNYNLEKKIKNYKKSIKIFRGKYILKNKNNFNKKSNYLAFCGLGTPESFFDLLRENSIKVKHKMIFPDHYNYSLNDIKLIKELSSKKNLKIVTTEKDYIKLKNINKFKIICAEVMLKIDKPNNFKKFLLDSL